MMSFHDRRKAKGSSSGGGWELGDYTRLTHAHKLIEMMTGACNNLPSSPLGRETTNPTSADVMNLQEAIVSNFAGLLGSMSSGHSLPHDGNAAVNGAKKSATSQDFDDCISETVNDCDIVCSLPSLDLNTNKVNEDITMNVPLPKVGEHHNNRKVPEMVASVLDTAGSAVVANAEKPEKSAAQNLGSIASWTKSTLIYAPTALAKGVAKSFMSLVESRVKAWTLLLLRQSLTYGDVSSRNRLLSMLSSKIELQTSITSFKTLALPEHARQQPKEADVILPLIFEVLLQVRSQQRNEIISLRAPGTIVGELIWIFCLLRLMIFVAVLCR
jgi:hypothetical protein